MFKWNRILSIYFYEIQINIKFFITNTEHYIYKPLYKKILLFLYNYISAKKSNKSFE